MVVFSILQCFLFPLIACFVPFSLGKGFSSWTLDRESLFKPSTCDRNLQKCASLAVQNSEFPRFASASPSYWMHLLSGMAWDWRDQASQPRCQLKASLFHIHHNRFWSPQFCLACLVFLIQEQAQTNPSFHTIGRLFLFFVVGIFHHFFTTFSTNQLSNALRKVKSPAHGSAFTCSGAPIFQWATASNLTLVMAGFPYGPTGKSSHFCRVFYIPI